MSNTLIKETQAAIERLMRWCAAKNKEPALPLEERAFVMDIEMVYTEAAKHVPPSVSDISPEEVNKLVAVWKRLYELGQEPTWRRIEDITKIPLKEIWQHD